MLKTALLVLGFSTAAATATFVFVGRTVHSSPFQMDIPYLSAVKTTIDPANVWSWHHEFTNLSWGTNTTADVLVDIDGNNIMDTEHSWLRVFVTDVAILVPNVNMTVVWLRDAGGKRYAASAGASNSAGPMQHFSLTTPIVLPVGSPLFVDVQGGPTCEVHLFGRVVNL